MYLVWMSSHAVVDDILVGLEMECHQERDDDLGEDLEEGDIGLVAGEMEADMVVVGIVLLRVALSWIGYDPPVVGC